MVNLPEGATVQTLGRAMVVGYPCGHSVFAARFEPGIEPERFETCPTCKANKAKARKKKRGGKR